MEQLIGHVGHVEKTLKADLCSIILMVCLFEKANTSLSLDSPKSAIFDLIFFHRMYTRPKIQVQWISVNRDSDKGDFRLIGI